MLSLVVNFFATAAIGCRAAPPHARSHQQRGLGGAPPPYPAGYPLCMTPGAGQVLAVLNRAE
jgi:hypothetical protein